MSRVLERFVFAFPTPQQTMHLDLSNPMSKGLPCIVSPVDRFEESSYIVEFVNPTSFHPGDIS